MKNIVYEFSELLYRERQKQGLNQIQLSRIAKIGENQIGNYERGDTIPSIKNAQKVLNKLGYDLKIVPLEN